MYSLKRKKIIYSIQNLITIFKDFTDQYESPPKMVQVVKEIMAKLATQSRDCCSQSEGYSSKWLVCREGTPGNSPSIVAAAGYMYT